MQTATALAVYSVDERTALLGIAREAIAAALAARRYSPVAPAGRLAKRRGVFTTLHVNGALRGCVGHVVAASSLVDAVAQTAVAAAFTDPRFAPLGAAELPQLSIGLSILSPLFPIAPQEIEVGRHGLLVGHGACRGLLLPQVATEHGWDRNEFLAQTCHKAGLAREAWRNGAELLAFTAEVFEETASRPASA